YLVLCLLNRQPQTSPLFPYTTLFRSTLLARRDNQTVVDDGEPRRKQERKAVPNVLAQERIVPRIEFGPLHALAVVATCPDVPFLDRKSTRLNSSHVSISYAVFCLKKK